ncbi:MAG: iron-sulfur cluster-binding protein, partial [Bacillota bacterium]
LGEYIIQLAGHKPSHIVAPAVHLSQQQIRELFSREAGRELPDEPEALAAFARERLREKFLRADVGISGANFVVAESGTVVLVTNEGNGRMVTSLPRVHIAVMGMERVVPTWEDLGVLLEVLARSATGQKITVYTTFAGGPRRPGEVDGPEEFHLVIVDNGRSNLLGTLFQEALHCIRCGACLNACPVYRQMGGHPYGGVYSGPIGAVITPLLAGFDGWEELPYASSLCGACHEACPVMIPLHDLLVDLREEEVRQGRTGTAERIAFRLWRWIFTDPQRYRVAARLAAWLQRPWLRREPGGPGTEAPATGQGSTEGGGSGDPAVQGASPRASDGLPTLLAGAVLRGGPGPLGAWTAGRDFPPLADRPFHARWAQLQEEGPEGEVPPREPQRGVDEAGPTGEREAARDGA